MEMPHQLDWLGRCNQIQHEREGTRSMSTMQHDTSLSRPSALNCACRMLHNHKLCTHLQTTTINYTTHAHIFPGHKVIFSGELSARAIKSSRDSSLTLNTEYKKSILHYFTKCWFTERRKWRNYLDPAANTKTALQLQYQLKWPMEDAEKTLWKMWRRQL